MDNTQAWLSWAQQPYDQGGLGLAPHQAAGIVGNLVRESGPGLPAWGPTGDNGTAWGTAQWRGDRLSGLKNYAAQNGLDFRDPTAQMGWMRQELTSTHAPAYQALKTAKTPEEAASAFNKLYEISADNTGGREASARAVLNGTDPVAAINSAAGIRQGGGNTGALSFSGDAASGEDQGVLSQQPAKDDSSGGVLFQGEKPNKLHALGAMLTNIASSLAGITNPQQAQALHAQAQSIEQQMSTGNNQYMMGANGQLVRINKQTGAVDSIAIPGASKDTWKPIMGKDDEGNPVFAGSFNPDTNEYKPAPGRTQGAAGAVIGGDPNLTGQERYDSLTSDEKKQIDAWRAGTGVQPSQYSMRNPKTAKMVDAANAIGIDMTRYGERQATLKGMASKSPTTAGGQFISAPTVMDHLLNVANDYAALGNSSGGGYSSGAAIANYLKDARGGTAREAQQTSADRNSDTASKEIVSFLTRGHGGVTERQDTHDKLYLPRAAPEVQAAALEAYRKQVADRFYELADGVKGSVGEDHPEVMKAVAAFKAKDAALQEKIAQLRSGKNPAPAANPAAPAPAAIPSSWAEAQKAGWK